MLPRRRRISNSDSEPFLLNNSWNHSITNTNSAYPNNVEQDYFEEPLDNIEPEPVMTARDRTSEFINTLQTLQGQNIVRAVQNQDPRRSRVIQSHTEFMLVAKNVGRNITNTYSKLEKLTLLAKRKSLFNDKSQEIQDLTYMIKSDLGSLNQQIAQLQEISKRQRHQTNGKHLQNHSSNVVLALQSKLASMSTHFKQVLEVRTENLKHQKSRREQFSQGGLPLPSSGPAQGSLLLQEENQVSINLDGALVPRQTQMQAALMYDETDQYLQNRAETMQNIESTIVELGGIFQQLAHMVKEQEEMVERIDTNVQDAELNIEAAHAQIVKYFQSVSSNRWLMIKIFGVLIFFFIFFVVFMA